MSSWTHWLRSPRKTAPKSRTHRPRKPRFREQPLPLSLEHLEARNLLSASFISLAATLSDTAAGNTEGPASTSANGRYIVYTNTAANLSPGQVINAKTVMNVFLFDRVTGTTTLVSHADPSNGSLALNTPADGTSENAVISADGSWIAFVSDSDNLIAHPNLNNTSVVGDSYQVYLYNVATNTNTLISHVASDQGAGYQSTFTDGANGILDAVGSTGSSLPSASSLASLNTSVSISGDGKYVTYLSTGTHLVNGQQLNANASNLIYLAANVFVYDRTTDTNYLVSREDGSPTNAAGQATTPGDDQSYVAVIDQNGDTIAFTSVSTDIVHGQTINSNYGFPQGSFTQVFVAKIAPGGSWSNETTALASHDLSDTAQHLPTSESTSNVSGPLDYPAPVLTPDGHWLAYVSDNAIVQNPISGTNAGMGDNVYLYDTTNPQSFTNDTLVSHIPGDSTTPGNADDGVGGLLSGALTTGPAPAISDDGRYVAFASDATDLTSTATSAGSNIYLFDRLATDSNNNVARITTQSIAVPSVLSSLTYPLLTPSISGDGRYIAYLGLAHADVSGLTNLNGSAGLDALVYDRVASTYTLLSHPYASATTTGNDFALRPVIDEGGDAVFYLDNATNLLPPTVNGHASHDLNGAMPEDGTDLFAYSLNPPASYTPLVAPGNNATVTLHDPSLPSLTANGLSEVMPQHSVSDDGRFTVFISDAPNLVPNEVDTNLNMDVYLYDNKTATKIMLSHAAGSPATTGQGESTNPVISADGTTVLFYSYATNLISGETWAGTPGQDVELYLYDNNPKDAGYGTLTLVSHTPGNPLQAANGTRPENPSLDPLLLALGGSPIAFTSTFLYSTVNIVGLGVVPSGLAAPSISADGQKIAYLSDATDIAGTNTKTTLNAYYYDRASGSNTLVSGTAGTTNAGNMDADTVAISADGSTVAFSDASTNLLSTATTNKGDELYVWRAGQIALITHSAASTTTAATGSNTSEWGPLPASLSATGDFIAYYFGGDDLVVNQAGTANPANVFLYNTTLGTNVLVSHVQGSPSTAGDNPANQNQREAIGPSISADGNYVAYANNSTNLFGAGLAGYNGQDNAYLYDNNPTDAGFGLNSLVSNDGSSPTSTTPDLNGGSAPNISGDGSSVAFIDLALTNNPSSPFTPAAYLWEYNRTPRKTTASVTVTGNTLTSVLEGTTYSDTPLATFSDTNTSDTASSFTASVDWGDGTGASTATITGGNGSFTVSGTHTYTDEGNYTFTVTITPIGAGGGNQTQPQLVKIGAAFDPTFAALIPDSLVPAEINSDGSVLEWDGPASAAAPGDENSNLNVIISAPPTTTGGSGTGTAPVAEADVLVASVPPTTFKPTEGTAWTGAVGSFTDTGYPGNSGSDFTATIHWGDGTPDTPGVVTVDPANLGTFIVSAGTTNPHTYADENTYAVTITVLDDGSGSASVVIDSTAKVQEGDNLVGTGASPSSIVEGKALSGLPVATFTDTGYPSNTPADFTASINWGDGTTSAGVITGGNGSNFVVTSASGESHYYKDEGTYTITVTMTDDSPGTDVGTATTTITATEADTLAATGVPFTPTEGKPVTGTVATFTTTYLANTADDFSATIDWGDGTQTAGVVTGSNGKFTVSAGAGGHTYADESLNTTVTVTIKDDAPGTATATATYSVTVGEGDTLTIAPATVAPIEGTAVTGPVATFTTTYLGNVAGDFSATITWGDGTTTTGTITGGNGNFTISAVGANGHIYADEGTANITVTVMDDAPGTATATETTAVTIGEGDNLAVTVLPITPTEGIAATGTVATFTTTYLANVAADFSATITWGDGTTTTGTITGGNGNFTVSAVGANGHIYADENTYSLSVTVKDDAPGTATATGSANITVQEGDTLAVTAVPFAPTEGIAVTGTVATFTTTYLANVAGDFSATINWGDGTSTTGTISGGNGNFTVTAVGAAGHTYADEGVNNVTVTIKDDAPGTATASANFAVTVAEGDVLAASPGTVSLIEGTPATGTLATFTTTYLGNVASDFSATINWGDGTTTAGTITGGNGNFTVTAVGANNHTFADEGTANITVTIKDDAPGTATAQVSYSAVIGEGDNLAVTVLPITPTEGIAATGSVATFTTTYLGNVAGDFSATITWGDGTTTTGTITGGNGNFTVSAVGGNGHIYADENTYTLSVTVNDDNPGTATATGATNITVQEGDTLAVTAAPIAPTEGIAVTGTLATFTTTYLANVASDFSATINWGDGTSTTGTISGGNGNFTVTAVGANGHTYADEGLNNVTVTVTDDAPGTATASSTFAVNVGEGDVLAATAAAVNPVEGIAVTGAVATFTTTYLGNTANDFSATINWGDGTSTTGTISGGNGNFTVTAVGANGHAYADEGVNNVTVTIKDDAPGTATTSVTYAVKVGEGDVLTASPGTIALIEGQPANGPVATFTTTYLGNVAGDFSATINWGDGTTTAGTITGGNGNFTVTAVGANNHAYADEGTANITVTINDDAPGTATATVSYALTIGEGDKLAVTVPPITPFEGLPVTGTVATFTTTYLANTAADFTATINWGDGSAPTTGKISGGNGNFIVTAVGANGHTYADEGNFPISVTVKDDAPGTATATGNGVAQVQESDQLAIVGAKLSVLEGTAIVGPVATFTTTYLGNVAADFVATIGWGDGTTTVGTVTGGNGVFTVSAIGLNGHIYADEGAYPLTVTVKDDAPGTAVVSTTNPVTVGEADVLAATALPITPTEGVAVAGPVATFTTTYLGNVAADFSATINWGDGSTTLGTITGGNGRFTVSAAGINSHIYADEGTYGFIVTISDDVPGTAVAVASAAATVQEGDKLTVNPVSSTAPEGTSANQTVATFTTTYLANVAGDFSATIDWGDGTTTKGTITGGNGKFTVSATGANTHAYADEGSFTMTVTVSDDAPGTATASAFTVNFATESDQLAVAVTPFSAIEGVALAKVPVATFTSTYAANTASDFTATIDWGDGTTSVGTITGAKGDFVVSATGHTYADEGNFNVTVTVRDDAPGTAVASGSASIGVIENDQLTVAAVQPTITVPEGQFFSGTVAVFNDTYKANPASDFTATIDWGDGTTTAATVVGQNGVLTVVADTANTHMYLDEGSFNIKVTIKDDAPGTATAVAQTTVVVTEADQLSGAPNQPILVAGAGVPFSGPVANFLDTYVENVASDFTATINWGDGTTTPGVVSGGNGAFTVSGSHTYAGPSKTELVTVTLSEDAPGTASATVSNNFLIGITIGNPGIGGGAAGGGAGGVGAGGVGAGGGGEFVNGPAGFNTAIGVLLGPPAPQSTESTESTPSHGTTGTKPAAATAPVPVISGVLTTNAVANGNTTTAANPNVYGPAVDNGPGGVSPFQPTNHASGIPVTEGTSETPPPSDSPSKPKTDGGGDNGPMGTSSNGNSAKPDAAGSPATGSGNGGSDDLGADLGAGFLSYVPKNCADLATQLVLLETWSTPVSEPAMEDKVFMGVDAPLADGVIATDENSMPAEGAAVLLGLGFWVSFAEDRLRDKKWINSPVALI